MTGAAAELVTRAEGSGLLVGWPGAPGDSEAFPHYLAEYENSTEGRVSSYAAGAFALDTAVQLAVLTSPETYLRRVEGGAVAVVLPTQTVAPLPSFFASPTAAPVVAVDGAALAALDPTTATSDEEKWRRVYALNAASTLRAIGAAPTVASERAAGAIPLVVSVLGVVLCGGVIAGVFRHLERVAQIEADADVRRTQAVAAEATRQRIESMRIVAERTPAGQPIDWSQMPPPSATDEALRQQLSQRAQSEWQRIASEFGRGVAQTGSSIATVVMWGGALYVAWKIFGGNRG